MSQTLGLLVEGNKLFGDYSLPLPVSGKEGIININLIINRSFDNKSDYENYLNSIKVTVTEGNSWLTRIDDTNRLSINYYTKNYAISFQYTQNLTAQRKAEIIISDNEGDSIQYSFRQDNYSKPDYQFGFKQYVGTYNAPIYNPRLGVDYKYVISSGLIVKPEIKDKEGNLIGYEEERLVYRIWLHHSVINSTGILKDRLSLLINNKLIHNEDSDTKLSDIITIENPDKDSIDYSLVSLYFNKKILDEWEELGKSNISINFVDSKFHHYNLSLTYYFISDLGGNIYLDKIKNYQHKVTIKSRKRYYSTNDNHGEYVPFILEYAPDFVKSVTDITDYSKNYLNTFNHEIQIDFHKFPKSKISEDIIVLRQYDSNKYLIYTLLTGTEVTDEKDKIDLRGSFYLDSYSGDSSIASFDKLENNLTINRGINFPCNIQYIKIYSCYSTFNNNFSKYLKVEKVFSDNQWISNIHVSSPDTKTRLVKLSFSVTENISPEQRTGTIVMYQEQTNNKLVLNITQQQSSKQISVTYKPGGIIEDDCIIPNNEVTFSVISRKETSTGSFIYYDWVLEMLNKVTETYSFKRGLTKTTESNSDGSTSVSYDSIPTYEIKLDDNDTLITETDESGVEINKYFEHIVAEIIPDYTHNEIKVVKKSLPIEDDTQFHLMISSEVGFASSDKSILIKSETSYDFSIKESDKFYYTYLEEFDKVVKVFEVISYNDRASLTIISQITIGTLSGNKSNNIYWFVAIKPDRYGNYSNDESFIEDLFDSSYIKIPEYITNGLTTNPTLLSDSNLNYTIGGKLLSISGIQSSSKDVNYIGLIQDFTDNQIAIKVIKANSANKSLNLSVKIVNGENLNNNRIELSEGESIELELDSTILPSGDTSSVIYKYEVSPNLIIEQIGNIFKVTRDNVSSKGDRLVFSSSDLTTGLTQNHTIIIY